MKRILIPLLFAVVAVCSPAAAQTPPVRDDMAAVRTPTADDTRRELHEILEQYPASVGEILRRDPSLMARADYMAAYPDLVKFLAAHPEVARNVEFYFEGYGSWQTSRRVDPTFEALGVLLGGMAGIFVLIAFLSTMVWLVRTFIQHRRWLKASQVQVDVHTKLMERLSGNEELLAYIQSAAGRRFLEAAPVRPDADAPSLSAPIGSIIGSLMAGIVLMTVGAGFRVAASYVPDEGHQAFVIVGVIILSLGIGFVLASMMAFAVSSKLGLFPKRAAADTTNA